MPGTFYVYVYRDLGGNPMYIGQGLDASRPGSHRAGSHNPAFDAWLKANPDQYRIEVLGPLGTQKMADAVETSLISLCKPAEALRGRFFNIAGGASEYRFRPYGVPLAYAARIQHPLGQADVDAITQTVGPIMFVRINQEDFDDGPGRVGYDLADPPTDDQVRARVEAWWQVRNRVTEWMENPQAAPALLLGVTGGIGAQMVIASARVDRERLAQCEVRPQGLIKVPLQGDDLDAHALRGRPIDANLQLRFNSFRQKQFQIFRSPA